MMRRAIITLAFGVATAGIFDSSCSAGPPLAPHFAIGPGFSVEQIAEIKRAATTWNQVTRPERRITIGDDGDWLIVHADPPELYTKGYQGETDSETKTVWIWPGVRPDLFFRVVLHEDGHSIGLHHVQGFAVMTPDCSAGYLTGDDLDECRRVGACWLPGEAIR